MTAVAARVDADGVCPERRQFPWAILRLPRTRPRSPLSASTPCAVPSRNCRRATVSSSCSGMRGTATARSRQSSTWRQGASAQCWCAPRTPFARPMMDQTAHPPEGVLREFLDGEASAASRVDVERHLATCPSCSARLAALEQPSAATGELLVLLPPQPLVLDPH